MDWHFPIRPFFDPDSPRGDADGGAAPGAGAAPASDHTHAAASADTDVAAEQRVEAERAASAAAVAVEEGQAGDQASCSSFDLRPPPEPVASPSFQEQDSMDQVEPSVVTTGLAQLGLRSESPAAGPAPPPTGPPTLTRPGFYTRPDSAALAALPDAALAALHGFVVGRTGVAEVAWEGAVDVRGLDLDAICVLEPGRIEMYPRGCGVAEPPIGVGLNAPAEIRIAPSPSAARMLRAATAARSPAAVVPPVLHVRVTHIERSPGHGHAGECKAPGTPAPPEPSSPGSKQAEGERTSTCVFRVPLQGALAAGGASIDAVPEGEAMPGLSLALRYAHVVEESKLK